MKNMITIISLLLACTVHASSINVDIGNGKKAQFEFTLVPKAEAYEAKVRVIGPKKSELWLHQWTMNEGDLKTMLEEEGRSSVDEWTTKFFQNKPFGMETFSLGKLTEEDMWPEFLDQSAKILKTTPADLKAAILGEEKNFLFTYRSTWREDLIALVFVPKHNRFVVYRGYGE